MRLFGIHCGHGRNGCRYDFFTTFGGLGQQKGGTSAGSPPSVLFVTRTFSVTALGEVHRAIVGAKRSTGFQASEIGHIVLEIGVGGEPLPVNGHRFGLQVNAAGQSDTDLW